MKPPEQTIAFLEAFQANGILLFDISVRIYRADGTHREFLHAEKTGNQGLSLEQVLKLRPFLAGSNVESQAKTEKNVGSSDVLIRPDTRVRQPYIFLDDVPLEYARKISAKYRTVIVETSARNTQIWIFTVTPISPVVRGVIQKEIASRIHADLSSADGFHFGRLPGFRNAKPSRKCWVNFIGLSDAPLLDFSHYAVDDDDVETEFSIGNVSLPLQGPGQKALSSGMRPTCGAPQAAVESDPGPRIFGWAVHAFRRGLSKEGIEARVLDKALTSGKSGAKKFVERTVKNAELAAQKNLP